MRNSAWNDLVAMAEGKKLSYLPIGLIIDSPWIPGWYGISRMDYYSSDDLWMKANLKVLETFPEVWFMPGFWSEYAMCLEPSAFGSRMRFPEKGLPHADRIMTEISQVDSLPKPNVKADGMLPFMINRLKINQEAIHAADHQIRFAIARGPMNIASYLMGVTDLMLALIMDPENSHKLLKKVTDFICEWITWQKECFPSIDGILILDDLIGFIGDTEYREFVVPYFKQIYGSFEAKINFLHNDAAGLITAKHLAGMGVNMFNFSFEHSLSTIRDLAGPEVILLGNIPPRDVLAEGSPDDVKAAVNKAFGEIDNYDRIVWSVGGAVPQDVPGENIRTFIDEIKTRSDAMKF